MRRRGLWAHRLVVAAFAVVLSFPFYWMVVTSFKRNSDLYDLKSNPLVFNQAPTLEHWRFLFAETLYPRWVANTFLVGLAVVAITLALAVPAAWGLARQAGRWGERAGIGIFLVYLVPPTLLFIPLSRVVAELGLQDSTWSLVVIYPTITIPVSVWLLIGFLKAIPRDIEEQAMVDGYSRVGAFRRIVIPLALPGIVAVVVFAFTLTAHEFIYALAFISPSTEKTISIGVPTELVRGDVFFWQSLQAAAVLVAVPIAFVFNLLLERFITGFTMGAVKS
jgi:multiple sugar transport system permease protein